MQDANTPNNWKGKFQRLTTERREQEQWVRLQWKYDLLEELQQQFEDAGAPSLD